MKRRIFLASACLAAILPAASRAADYIAYTPGVIEEALGKGETVFVDYSATWCSTCKRQERILEELRSANPAFDEAMVFVKVDWDEYSGHEVTTSRAIPRRSTLIVLRGNEELGRIVAGTAKDEIEALLAKGL